MIDTLVHHPHPLPAEARTLLILLPGAGITAEDFATHGLITAVQELPFPIDVIAASPDMGLYLDDEITEAIHHTIIQPAAAQNYQNIWLLGISLGGMGALLYASQHADLITGIILLAPFIGTQGTIAELAASGGLANWKPETSSATNGEKRLLTWLQHRPDRPALFLGYGTADRFAAGHRLLAQTLPSAHVLTHAGGHDWPTWLALSRALLPVLAETVTP